MLFVGAYRDNEVSEDHPAIVTQRTLKEKGGVPSSSICLGPLSIQALYNLISDLIYAKDLMVNR